MGKENILVVVDMQNDFIDGSLGTKEAVAILPKVAEKIKNFQGLVFFTQDTHKENYQETLEGKNLPVPHCITGTPGHDLNSEIKLLCEEKMGILVEKDTFGSRKLVDIILTKYKTSPPAIELVGLCTDICVISNALLLKAYFPETEITVDASCCAGVTPETHKNALAAMKMCQITIMNGE